MAIVTFCFVVSRDDDGISRRFGMNQRRTPDQWRTIAADYERGNETHGEFCRRGRIPISRFHYNRQHPSVMSPSPPCAKASTGYMASSYDSSSPELKRSLRAVATDPGTPRGKWTGGISRSIRTESNMRSGRSTPAGRAFSSSGIRRRGSVRRSFPRSSKTAASARSTR